MSSKKVEYHNNAKSLDTFHNVSAIVRSLMKRKGVDDATVWRATGIAPSSLSRIKNDVTANPTLGSLVPLADYFNVTVSQLIGETSLNEGYISEPMKHHTIVIKQVPLIAWEQIEGMASGKIEEFKHWVPTDRTLSGRAFALIVTSANWGEVLRKGACLLFDPEMPSEDGDYVLIYSASEKIHYMKKILKEGGEVYLQSLNPNIQTTEKPKSDETVYAPAVEVRLFLK